MTHLTSNAALRKQHALALPLANPRLSRSQRTAPPSEPEQRGRRRGYAEAWRACPAGPLQEGAP
eukprot:3767797-Alexandrium_andersonii.AAC.1